MSHRGKEDYFRPGRLIFYGQKVSNNHLKERKESLILAHSPLCFTCVIGMEHAKEENRQWRRKEEE